MHPGATEVLTPKHDLSMISGGAPGNVEEETMNIHNNNFNNLDYDEFRNSLVDFKTAGPPRGVRRNETNDESHLQQHRRASRASSFAASSVYDDGKFL